jgi:DNA-binding CsgD family transcriptional regulator
MGVIVAVPPAEEALASVALMAGDVTDAARHVQRYQSALDPLAGALGTAPYLLTEALVAEARDGPARAFELLEPVYDDLNAHRLMMVTVPTAGASLARTAVAVGDRERAKIVVDGAALAAAWNPGFTSLSAGAAHARGVALQDVGALDEAAARHRQPWARASAMEDGGVVLAQRDEAGARAHLEQGLAGYEDMASARDADRVHARLRALGSRSRTGRDHRSLEGWSSLTATEQRVSHLVADGLTNSQVASTMSLSRHTVDFHLRQVFRKLNIRSRVDLTRVTLEHGGI